MKKVILVLAIGFLASCKKEEPQPTQPTQPEGCNCYKAYEKLLFGQWEPYYDGYDGYDELRPCEIDGDVTYETATIRYTWVCQ